MAEEEPLLWELDADDRPSAPVLPPEAVDEIEMIETARDEHPDEMPALIAEALVQDQDPNCDDRPWLGGDAGRPTVDEQPALFEMPPSWTEQWKGMPEFAQRDLAPWQSIYVHFRNAEDRNAFASLIGQPVGDRTRSVWHPKAEIARMMDKRFKTSARVDPIYPVYIISKGRWESRLTSKSLEAIGVPYRIVVEPQEVERYAAVIDPAKIIELPFSNLGQGSIPARNFVWEHALASGAARHWILDDNIDGFYRLFQNLKTPVETGATFRAAEEFTDRYANVALSGFNYFMFASRKTILPPFTLNTRIYSCILIRNDLTEKDGTPFRWRGRYNEDTDLAIRLLKDGHCTILFNAFLAMKSTTMTMKGGNTDELYKEDGRAKMAESLRAQHPDCVIVTEKWGRPQHHVDYKRFRPNRLIVKPGVALDESMAENNFGMELEVDPADAAVDGAETDGAQPT